MLRWKELHKQRVTAVLRDKEDKVRASFPPSNQCLHPPQHQWLVNEQDVYQSPKTTWLERTQATNACTETHDNTSRRTAAWH